MASTEYNPLLSYPMYPLDSENRDKLDSESGSVHTGEGKLVRQLKNRHVAMIRYENQAQPSLQHSELITDAFSSLVLEDPSAQVRPSS